MAKVEYGTVTVTIPDNLVLPEQAGKLSPEEIARIPKPPRGIGLVCDDAADQMEKLKLQVPGVTAKELREKGRRAEEIDRVIDDVTVALEKLKQGNVIFDAEAWEALRRVNEQVKAQGKFDDNVMTAFRTLTEFVTRKKGGKAEQK